MRTTEEILKAHAPEFLSLDELFKNSSNSIRLLLDDYANLLVNLSEAAKEAETIQQCVSKLKALLAKMTWQAIETAPIMDEILIFQPAYGIEVAHFEYVGDELQCWGSGKRYHPTHWQPLPEPPKEESKQ